MKNGTIQIICGKRNIFNRNQWKMPQFKWKMAQFNLIVANAYFEAKSTKKRHNRLKRKNNHSRESSQNH